MYKKNDKKIFNGTQNTMTSKLSVADPEGA